MHVPVSGIVRASTKNKNVPFSKCSKRSKVNIKATCLEFEIFLKNRLMYLSLQSKDFRIVDLKCSLRVAMMAKNTSGLCSRATSGFILFCVLFLWFCFVCWILKFFLLFVCCYFSVIQNTKRARAWWVPCATSREVSAN